MASAQPFATGAWTKSVHMVMDTPKKLTALIVEDEFAPRQALRRMLEQRHASTLTVIAEADNGPAALELCEEHKPDILFLDLHLPGIDGVELLHQVSSDTHVIITTAHDDLAVEAFRANAVDYLMKPIEPGRLKEAIARVSSSIGSEKVVRLLCRDRDRTVIVHTADVQFLRAEGGYTHVQTSQGYQLMNESLTALERRLPNHFVRIHRNTVVNVHHISAIRHEGEATALIGDEHELSISRRHYRDLRRRLTYEQ